MTEETAKTPEWMLLLENKKKRPHRLAHDIGAGAPCLSCGDGCPGLDLHFWRKLCRNCKCKKEEHDVKDDEGYEQFEILFANSGVGRKKRTGAFLNIKVPETSVSNSSSTGNVSSNIGAVGNKKEVAFDWIPPDVPEDVAAEYMQQLPPSKLPISGSDGALYRRQQLESQIPLHDLDATKCHGLTADEIQGLQQYLENVKNNVVGQGRVTKLPVLYAEQRLKYSGPSRHQSTTAAQASLTGESRPIRIASSQSAQSLKSLPSFPLPRPYIVQQYDKDDLNSFPPPPPDLLPTNESNVDLKTPSAFLPPAHHGSYQTDPINTQIFTKQGNHGLAHSSQLPINKTQSSAALAQALGGVARDSYKQYVETSTQVPGRYYDPVMGRQGDSVEEGSHMGLQDERKPQTHARDGTFVADQQAHDIAYSTQIPVGLISQHSRALNLPRDSSNSVPSRSEEIADNEVGRLTEEGITRQSGMHMNNSQDMQTFPMTQDGKFYTVPNPHDVPYSTLVPGGKPQYLHLHYGDNVGSALPEDHTKSELQTPTDVVTSSVVPGKKSSTQSIPSYGSIASSQGDGDTPHNADNVASHTQNSGSIPAHDAKLVPYSTNVSGQVAHSAPIAGDSMPKSAHMLHQSHLVQQEGWELDNIENELSGKLEQIVGLGDAPVLNEKYHLKCHKCNDMLQSGQVAVLAERAGKQAAWHPQCFVCCTCEELLVDLIYFYHKGDVFCGRHYAELLNIPRCFACDELIFVKEYTCAEGKAFHVKHFCCYECDVPLGGKQYIPKDNQPMCLQCFEDKYGKSCHTCKSKIAPGDQRVGWKELSWHVSPSCFRCSKCLKSLLGGKFLVKNEQPYCSKECAQSAILKSN